MVVSRSDAKRRQKEGQESPSESPKRTKVHAQRKFAQGSNLNTPVLTPVKDKDKSKVNGTVVSTQLLPTKRPNTEDFLNFLCFRGTPILPPKLEFFNVATTPEQLDEDTKMDQSVPGTSKISTRSEKNTPEQTFTVAKAETRSRNKPKTTAAVQAFKKKYQEQQLAKQKMSLTKLALKVKGKNMVRTRSASILEENRRLTKTVSQGTSSTNIPLVKTKTVQKPTIKKPLKRLVPKHVVGSLRGGLRSGGELPPGSDVGLKTERKPRIIKEQELSKNKQLGKRLKNQTIKAIASSLSDFSSDDDQPLIKKQKINLRNKKQHLNISSIRPNQLRLRSNRPPIVKHIVPNRPTRKTKEAAALFLEEMIGKDLRSPDEDSDYIDEDFTDKSYLEPSTSKKTEQKEIKATPDKINKNKITKKGTPKKENDFKANSPKKKEDLVEDTKLLRKSVVRLNILKEKPSKLLKEKILDNKVVKKEEKIVPSRKKVSMKKSDNSHSEGETSKTNVVVKRCTRQRPESLELDNLPKLVKTTDVDDRFSDSDEEPLGNITGPTSSKQLNVRKSTVSKKAIPLIKKEMSKKQSKNDEIVKVYDKQIKDDIIKSKSITKKDVSKKSIQPGNSSSSEGKCESKNECRSKTRYNKSIDDVPDKNKKIDNKCSKKIDVKKEELNTKDSLAINVDVSVLSKTKSKKVSKECSESLELNSKCSINKDSGVTALNESISSKLESTTNIVDLNNSTNKNKLKQTKRCEEDNITLVENLPEENSNVLKNSIKKNTNKFSTEKEACDSKEEVPQQVGKSPGKNVVSSAPDLSSEPKSKKGKLKKLAPLDGKNALNKSIVESCEDDKNMVVPQISSDIINISEPISDKSVTAGSKLDRDVIINVDSLLPEPVHKSSDEPAKKIKNIANKSIIEKILSTKGKGDSEMKKENMIAGDKVEKGFKFEESSDIVNVNTIMKTNHDIKPEVTPKNIVLPDQPTSQDVQVHTSSPIMSETNYGQSTAASENNESAVIGQTVPNHIQKDVQQFVHKKKEGKNNSNNNDRKLPDSNFSTIVFDPQKIDHKTTGTVNNNFDSTESLGNPMKVIPKKTISTGQPLASKFVPYNIENPNLPILPMPKLNIEQQSVSKLEHTVTSNKMPQQRQEIHWVDKNVSGKVEERHFFKEVTKSNVELRVSEDKPVMKMPQKNEQYFGNMKEVKSSAVIDPKFKPDVPLPGFQILKSSAKPKSMLKPGTLIDIAGGLNVGLQSESMNAFMRPPLDNAMTKAIKTDFVSDYSPAQSQGYNPAVPQPQRTDFNSEPPSFAPSKVKEEFIGKTIWAGTIKKERVESPIQFKNRTAVSNTWRQAFKHVKLPGESSTATSADKPVAKKPLSVTALAKKHILTKSDTSSPEKSLPTQQSIPFLRQSKLFLGVSQSQVNKSRSSNVNVKPRPTEEIDMNNLREKEEEFLRSFVGGDFAKISTDLNNTNVGIEKQIIQTETLIIQPRDEHIDLSLPKISNVDIRRTNSPIQNVSVSIEEKGLRFDNDRTKSRSNSPFTLQSRGETVELNSPGTSQDDDLNLSFPGSVFSVKDRTPSPSSRHIPIPALPVFTKSVPSVSPIFPEAKHHSLPFSVEHTLKKISLSKMPSNKKSVSTGSNPAKLEEIKDVNLTVKSEEINNRFPKSDSEPNMKSFDHNSASFDVGKDTSSSAHCLNPDISPLNIDLMEKKKVNMSREYIKKWLSDSTSVGIEHKQNCGIFDRNHCECGYKTVSSGQISENVQEEKSVKCEENVVGGDPKVVIISEPSSSKSSNNLTETIIKSNEKSVETIEEEKRLFLSEKKSITQNIKIGNNEENIFCEPVLNKTPSPKVKRKNIELLKLPDPNVRNKIPVENVLFESNMEDQLSPITLKPKYVRQSNYKPGDSEAELSSRDPSEVSSPPPRDDLSSNDDSPDKFAHPEKRMIFQQRRAAKKVKIRKEILLSPSPSAFSPDNESSVYAFDPDPPPTNTTPPFRRCRKDGRTSSTATDDDESTPSSASIAVQVNLNDNEAVLECSTQTEDDNQSEGHLFYIPLQQSHADVAKTQQMIQGVEVKLGTEGPDQKVIMRAKLVTGPPSTFSRQPSPSSARALMSTQTPRSGKPEQKVRPLSVKPPVGTVTPTTRASLAQTSPEPDTCDIRGKNSAPGPSKTVSESEGKPSKTKSPESNVQASLKMPKRSKGKQPLFTPVSICAEFPTAGDCAKLVEAPTFHPNAKEFQDPLEYINSIRPLAEKFGLCRIVPPSDFKPECKVCDDMRFTAYNQYIHKMLHRWGPNVKEMMAIKKYLATQSIALNQPPWVGGMEIDLPRLYQTVQVCGGLKEVIEKKRWYRVADSMKIPKSAQDRVTKLDDIYCKFLLPYDTLSLEERNKLFEEVENDWREREKRVNNADEDDSEESDSDDIDECIVKGRSMALNAFYRIARNTMSMYFSKTEQPSASEVEAEFWRHVDTRQCHVCVHSGSIDSGSVGYGFPVAKNSSTSRHPWNLKVLTNNPGSILRSLGPIMGVTVPTLHVGMLFSACCWYRDPHGLPWIEYLHTGASKIWYGIPDSSSSVFREAVTKLVPRLCRDKTIWLASDTAMVPPPMLVEKGVSLCRVVQEPGQFIVVFPKVFTSSICTGYLVSESVYFAQPSWLATAQQIFDDIRESCEPSMFSLEKLLFSIATDTRSSVDVLNQILPMMLSIQDEEIARRKQLEELGLLNSERLPVNKRRKTRPTNDEEADYECDICRANLFLSFVTNTHEDGVYCLFHAIELLSKKRSQLKHCNFIYTYSEEELLELVQKLKSRIEIKSQKKLQGKNVQANKS